MGGAALNNGNNSVSFGFTDQRFPPGTHVCQIYTDEEEREHSLLQFVLAGIKNGERTACFSEKVNVASLKELIEAEGIPFDEALKSGAISLSGTRDVYFRDGYFDPENMLQLLKKYHTDSKKQKYHNARVIGEMTADIKKIPGGDRLIEYESRVSMLLQKHPITSVCQYSAHDFNGAILMDVLKVHPYMVVRGAVVHNPFYIPPEEFLAAKKKG